MRGSAINPLGMLYRVFNEEPPFTDALGPLSAHEAFFWFARVQVLDVDVALLESFEGVDWSDSLVAPKGFYERLSDGTIRSSLASTEADLHRPTALTEPEYVEWTKAFWRFSYSVANPDWPGGPPNIPGSGAINLTWMNGLGHAPAADIAQLWSHQFRLSGGLASLDTDFAFSTFPDDLTDPVASEATVNLTATNIVQGEAYDHQFVLYRDSAHPGELSGTIDISAAVFFTYDDTDGNPLYNAFTGAYVI